MRPTRRLLLSALPAAALIGRAQAQSPFPDRPVRYIVPFPPGGLTDIMARLVAQKLSDIWSKPVIIENRAGGNALIGADAAAKSPADGYTLLAITMTHTVNASLFPAAPFNFRQDFTAISVLGSLPLVVVVALQPLKRRLTSPSCCSKLALTKCRSSRLCAKSPVWASKKPRTWLTVLQKQSKKPLQRLTLKPLRRSLKKLVLR